MSSFRKVFGAMSLIAQSADLSVKLL